MYVLNGDGSLGEIGYTDLKDAPENCTLIKNDEKGGNSGGDDNGGGNNDKSPVDFDKYDKDAPEGYEVLFRLYNPNSGEHFYTSNKAEGKNLVNLGWNYEGLGWIAPKESNTPVYRLYNYNSGEHHYTKDWNEAVFLFTTASGNDTGEDIKESGWDYEGIGWYSDDNETTPLYRLYNPNAKGKYEAGAHHYTKDKHERDYLVSIGWNNEEIGWYAY